MKPTQLIAAAVTAAVLGTAGVSIAGASSDGGSAPATTVARPAAAPAAPAVHRRARRIRHQALKVAADTIGIEPKALRAELRAGKSIADVATEHDVDPNTVIAALVDAATTKINTAKTNGLLTDRQATRLLAHLTDRITNAVHHPGISGAHRNHDRRAHRRVRQALKIAADTIGIEPKALRAELRAGKSIADVATEHHVDPNTVITALVDAATTKINTAKTNGLLTDQQATRLLAHLTDRVTRLVRRHFDGSTQGIASAA